jgi:serine/threonine-protein kinase
MGDAPDIRLLRDRVADALGAQYRLGSVLGRGGMAVVFAAEDLRLQRPVALKVLPPDLAVRTEVRERFVREAQVAARLNHPHIVAIYAVHETPQLVCFAMAQVTGETLAERLRREPRLPWGEVASLLEQVADALAYAHAAGVVHRDIKPDNVLLDRGTGRALVTDFGIARAAQEGNRLTQTGIAMGTPSFMSPEQATGDREVDGRSDLYGLGVVGYVLLTGALPFEAPNTPALLLKHVSEPLLPVHGRRPEVPAALAAVVERCLAKRPDERFPHALALRDTLRRMQRDGSLAEARPGAPQAHAMVPRPVPASVPAPVPGAVPVAPPAPAPSPPGGGKPGHRHEDWAPVPAAPVPAPPPAPWGRTAGASVSSPVDEAGAVERRERRVRKFQGEVASSGVLLLFLGVINALTSSFPWVLWVLFGIVMSLMRRFRKLHEDGVGWREVLGRPKAAARGALPSADSRATRREARLAQVAGPEVLASALGPLVRTAVDDRLALADVAATLSPSDRAQVPELDDTADALLNRIGVLASGLERLERDLPADLAPSPLAGASAEQAALVARQQAALEALAARREEMRHELDRAALALRTLRVDLVRLRTMGMGAALADGAGATQEVRALSQAVGRAVEAADEVRKL